MSRQNLARMLGLLLAPIFISCSVSTAYGQTFVTIDHPNARSTICTAINTQGEIGGTFIDRKGVIHGFYSTDQVLLHEVHAPYAFADYVWGIDELGNIAGTWGYSGRQSGYSGFIISPNKVIQYVFAKISFTTEVLGISPTTHVTTGFYVDYDYQYYGFYSPDIYSFYPIQYPSAIRTIPHSGNDQNQFVGTYQAPLGGEHGFFYDGISQYMNMDFPGALNTIPYSINNAGEIVGTYQTADYVHHGFTYINGTYTTVDFPGGTDTKVFGLNSLGAIVGQYTEVSGRVHGFIDLP